MTLETCSAITALKSPFLCEDYFDFLNHRTSPIRANAPTTIHTTGDVRPLPTLKLFGDEMLAPLEDEPLKPISKPRAMSFANDYEDH